MNSGSNTIRWLKVLLLGFILGVAFAFVGAYLRVHDFTGRRIPAPFRLSSEAGVSDLTRVINSQLSAFRGGDYRNALTFADAAFRGHNSAQDFEQMVKTGYPVLPRSKSAAFGIIFDNGEEALVNVALTDESGQILHYRYLLRRERAGWKVSAVFRVRPDGTTV